MNAKAETQSSMDLVKWGVVLALLGGAVGAFYYYSEQSLLLRVIGLLVVSGVAVAVALQTARGQSVWSFAKDARTEVRKVVWPGRSETMQTTLLVGAMVIVVAIILWLFDMTLLWAVKQITGQGG